MSSPSSGTSPPPPSAQNVSSPPPPPPPGAPAPKPPPGPGGLPPGALIVLILGIGIGVILVLTGVCFFVILRRRRSKRHWMDSSGVPLQGPKDDPFGGPHQHMQQYAPPGRLIPPALPLTNSSLDSGKPLLSPSPGLSFGLSKSTFTYEELAMATHNFSDTNLLGQGGFGYVHKGILPNGREVAIKQLKAGSGQGDREFQAEVEIISRIHHRHLVSLVGYCMSGTQRMLVYEFVPNQTLEFHLHGKGRPTMSWTTRMNLALGSARGLAYLHEDCQPKIIHRDIKAANILLDHKFEAKVADFGLAKFSLDTDTHVSTRVMGTFGYLAPEYAASGKLTEKSDVFSFGVVLLELISGRRPVDKTQSFTDDSMVEWARPLLGKALEDGNIETIADPRLQKDYNPEGMARMVACAAACVRHSAGYRPRMSQIVRVLEGHVSLESVNEGIRPGDSVAYSSYGSSDFDTSQYNDDMKKFRKMALESQEHSTSEHSEVTTDYGLRPSGSSSEGLQSTQESETGKPKDFKTTSESS